MSSVIDLSLPSQKVDEIPLQEQTNHIHVSDFSAHVARMKADRDHMFELEYNVRWCRRSNKLMI